MTIETFQNGFWSVSGATIIIEPGETETLLEWICPDKMAAILTNFSIGMDDGDESCYE